MAVVAKSAMIADDRFDAQFFRKAYLAEDQALHRHPLETIGSFAKVTDGPHGYHEVDELSPVAMLTARSAADWFATRVGTDTISAKTHAANMRSSLAFDDIILGTRGTVGNCALVSQDILPANIDQDVARITLTGDAPVKPQFVAAYLNCRFGQDHIVRHSTGMVQQGITLAKVRNIPIPVLSVEFQEQIHQLVTGAWDARKLTEEAQQTAEATLIGALGLGGWSPPEPLTYIRSAAAVLNSARLDSQYYMPAKFRTLDALKAMSSQSLGEVFDSVRDMIDPAKGTPTDLVRNYDLTDALEPILDDRMEPMTLAEIGSQKKRLVDGDLAVSRLRAYLREIAVVRAGDAYPKVGSSEFIVLRPNAGAPFTLSPETLMVWLRSTPVQIILKWCQDGSQHPRFSEGDLLSIPLPDKLAEIDGQIMAAVQTGLAARAESSSLLATAKRAVEIAIEDSEAAALAFLGRA